MDALFVTAFVDGLQMRELAAVPDNSSVIAVVHGTDNAITLGQ